MIDGMGGSAWPPVETGGYRMIDGFCVDLIPVITKWMIFVPDNRYVVYKNTKYFSE